MRSMAICKTPANFIDLTGKRFHHLEILERDKTGTKNTRVVMWLCKCDCGKVVSVRSENIRSGHSKSCGCLKVKRGSETNHIHGMSRTKIHGVWCRIISRCESSTDHAFQHYGGRGIKVCDSWHDFRNFLNDMGHPPTPRHSIDRIDVNGNYEPQNCRWSTAKEQARNRRNNHLVTIGTKTMSVAEWAETNEMSGTALRSRIARGWDPVEAITKPVRLRRCL